MSSPGKEVYGGSSFPLKQDSPQYGSNACNLEEFFRFCIKIVRKWCEDESCPLKCSGSQSAAQK